jgi:hypothetical protein
VRDAGAGLDFPPGEAQLPLPGAARFVVCRFCCLSFLLFGGVQKEEGSS